VVLKEPGAPEKRMAFAYDGELVADEDAEVPGCKIFVPVDIGRDS
jgi:hypothetical protein